MNQTTRLNKFSLIFAILLVLMTQTVFSENMPLIKEIEVKGNKKISVGIIKDKLISKMGKEFNKSDVQKDIRVLYKLGYFDDIQVDLEPFEGGVKLIYLFKEKPTITSIDIQGLKELKKEDIQEKMTIHSGAIANDQLINENTKLITAFYQSKGFWLATVVPVVRVVSEDEVALTYKVNERTQIVIKDIEIQGNQALSDKTIKAAMKTKERWLLSIITGTGFYQKEMMDYDMEAIRSLYHDNGYLDVVVSEPVVKMEKDNIFITLTIDERSQYHVGSVTLTNNTQYPTDKLLLILMTKSGEVFSRGGLKNDVKQLLDLYMIKGYAMADVNPVVKSDKTNLLVDVDFQFTEGDVFTVGRINIQGNTKTRDKVIRREFRLNEGDTFNQLSIERSKERINNLQYFDTVDVQTEVKEEDKEIDVNVSVKERLTGMISLGGGYSSRDNIIGLVEVTETNLFGRGLYLKVKGELSGKTTNYSIGVQDPWLFDKPISGSVNVFNEEYEYPGYDQESKGFSFGLGKELTEYISASTNYRLEREEIKNVDAESSYYLREQEGRYTTSSIGLSLIRDSRNNLMDPTSGNKNAFYGTLAGLGGNRNYYKFLVDSGWYIPFKWDTTYFIRGRFGYADGYSDRELPVDERFYVGGITTVRGIDYGEAGPRDDYGEEIGGDMEMIFNAEYIFPIVKSLRLKGVVFFDAGTSYDRDMDYSLFGDLTRTAGLGVRWVSPFGPVRVEWGYNFSHRDDQETSKFEFAFGSSF